MRAGWASSPRGPRSASGRKPKSQSRNLLVLIPRCGQSPRTEPRIPGAAVEKVTGIGGVFFRARNPKALAEWYRIHLGVDVVPDNYDERPWQQQAGPTAYAPFPEDTSYFGKTGKQWMISFRVANLDAMANQLRAAKI